MRVTGRRLGGELRALARRRRHSSIQAGGRLEDHERPLLTHRRDEGLVQPHRFVAGHAGLDHDAALPESGEAPALDERKRIFHRSHDADDAGGHDPLGAWPGAAGMDARFERAVQRGAPCPLTGFLQRSHLGMGFAGAFMATVADDDAFRRDDTGADERVGGRPADGAARMLERPPHPPHVRAPKRVVYHFC